MAIINTNPMALPVPVVGSELGPAYATDINNCMALIAQHNHTAGQGNQIPPGGLNINSSLTMNDNPLIDLQYLGFTPTTSSVTGLESLYVVGVDLVYTDGNANVIPITANGSVTGAAGTITGLPSGTAGVAYNSGTQTYVFTAATSLPANLDSASIIIRDQISSGNGVSLIAPNAIATNYSLTLPTLPASNLPLILGTSGILGAAQITTSQIAPLNITDSLIALATITGDRLVPGTITSTQLNNVTIGESAECLSYSNSTATFSNVTNLDITQTVSGRPVQITFIPSNAGGFLNGQVNANQNWTAQFKLLRDGTTIMQTQFSGFGQTPTNLPPASLNFIDLNAAAGGHTWQLQAAISVTGGTGTVSVTNCFMIVYEIR